MKAIIDRLLSHYVHRVDTTQIMLLVANIETQQDSEAAAIQNLFSKKCALSRVLQ